VEILGGLNSTAKQVNARDWPILSLWGKSYRFNSLILINSFSMPIFKI